MSLHLADSFKSVYLPSMGTDRGQGNNLQVISDAVYNTAPSLRQAGMEFAVWVFKHGASEQLEKAAPDILQGLWAQLEAGSIAFCILLGLYRVWLRNIIAPIYICMCYLQTCTLIGGPCFRLILLGSFPLVQEYKFAHLDKTQENAVALQREEKFALQRQVVGMQA